MPLNLSEQMGVHSPSSLGYCEDKIEKCAYHEARYIVAFEKHPF